MRLKEIVITRYGPVRDISLDFHPGLHVVYGGNDHGKTLTIDATLKILLSRAIIDFEGINRVQEQPEGFVIMERGEKEIKISQGETLSDYLWVESHDLRNIFVIRNSDLSILSQSDYFRSFADRMVGLQTDRITLVLRILQRAGWLTRADSRASLSGSRENDYMGRRASVAKTLLSDAESYLEQVETKRLDEVEYQTIQTKRNIQKLEGSIGEMEKARNKQRYDEASSALQEIETKNKEIKQLEPFEESILNEARQQQQELDGLETEIHGLKESLKQEKTSLQEEQENLEKLEAKLKPLTSRATEVGDLKTKIGLLQDSMKHKAKTVKASSTYWRIFLASLVSSVLSFLVVTALLPLQMPFLAFPLILLLISVIFIILYLRAKGISDELEADVKALLSDAASSGIDSRNLNNVLECIAKLQDQQSELENRVEANSTDVHRLEGSIETNEARLKEKTDKAEKLESTIVGTLKRMQIDSLEAFSGKVELKQQLSSKVKERIAHLRGVLGVTEENEEEDIEYWKKEIQKLELYSALESTVSFDETVYENMRKKRNEEESKLQQLEAKLERHMGKLRFFHEEAIRIRLLNSSGEEVDVEVVTTSDLKELAQRLRAFTGFIDRRFNAALAAVKIFQKVISREERKVAILFEEDPRVKELFSQFTSGRYIDVRYNSETKTIEVKLGDKWLDASKLGKGTKDQLYMAVRISLAERLFPDEPSFFILDDPFLTSDSTRLKKEMSALKELCDKGWSAVYFTVKDEVVNLAEEIGVPLTRLRPL